MENADANSCNSVSFKRVRLPPLGSPSQKLGIDSLSSSDKIQPHIALLNERALISITQSNLTEALDYLQQAEKLLELVAARGKSIDRQLILAILTNQAHIYQLLGHLQWTHQYLQAVLYNLHSYLDHPQQKNLQNCINNCLSVSSSENSRFMEEQEEVIRIFLNRTHHLARAQLQFSWILSLENQHNASVVMASESISSMISHLNYSFIYKYQQFTNSQGLSNMIESIRNQCQAFSTPDFWVFQQIQRSSSSLWHYNQHEEYELSSHKLNNFLKVSLEQYNIEEVKRRKLSTLITNPFSIQKYAQKMVSIACAFYLMSDQKAKDLQTTKDQLKKSANMNLQIEMDISQETHQAAIKAYRSHCINLVLKYLPSNSVLASQLVQLLSLTEEQLSKYNRQPLQTDNNGQIKININTVMASPLLIPTTDTFALDLSCADSVDINCSNSNIESNKATQQGFTFGKVLEPQTYFDFMPKVKSNNSNPLFQGTNNLYNLKKQQNRIEISNQKESVEISIEQILASNQKKAEAIKSSKSLLSNARTRKNSEDESKLFFKNNIKRKCNNNNSTSKKNLQIPVLTHSISANSLFQSKKEKSLQKNPEISSLRSIPNPSDSFKNQQVRKNKANGSSDGRIKLNRIKSPLMKLKTDKADKPKVPIISFKSKSNNKSTKVNKSKSKDSASGKKSPPFKKNKGKFEPVYLHKK